MTPLQQRAYDRVREEIIVAARTGPSDEVVRSLNLSDRGLVELPSEIGQCGQLRRLYLRGNRIQELPPEMGDCTELRLLNLGDNQLTELPPEAGRWTELDSLFLNGNRLRSLPPELEGWGKLQTLNLSDNRLTTLPLEVRSLQSLRILDLSGNQLTALPTGIRGLRKLRALYLHGNKSLGLPPRVLGCPWAESGPGHEAAAEPTTILDYYFAHNGAGEKAQIPGLAIEKPGGWPVSAPLPDQRVRPLTLFVSYASSNKAQLAQLVPHLKWLESHGYLTPWDDSQLIAGQEYDQTIREKLAEADLILLLVSTTFLVSEYVRNTEIPVARERHRQKLSRVVWVRLNAATLSATDPLENWIASLQCATRGRKPISSYSPRENGWIEVRHSLQNAIEDFRRERQPP